MMMMVGKRLFFYRNKDVVVVAVIAKKRAFKGRRRRRFKRRLFDESSFEAFASNTEETKSERGLERERERERVHFWSAINWRENCGKKIGKKNWKEKNR